VVCIRTVCFYLDLGYLNQLYRAGQTKNLGGRRGTRHLSRNDTSLANPCLIPTVKKVYQRQTVMLVSRRNIHPAFILHMNLDGCIDFRQSRIMTPLATSVSSSEEQSMSSGDESDDEDLTDAETSDSDWSDTGEHNTYAKWS